ncbi:unnamed protein product, partial [Trichogramma brassicae]
MKICKYTRGAWPPCTLRAPTPTSAKKFEDKPISLKTHALVHIRFAISISRLVLSLDRVLCTLVRAAAARVSLQRCYRCEVNTNRSTISNVSPTGRADQPVHRLEGGTIAQPSCARISVAELSPRRYARASASATDAPLAAVAAIEFETDTPGAASRLLSRRGSQSIRTSTGRQQRRRCHHRRPSRGADTRDPSQVRPTARHRRAATSRRSSVGRRFSRSALRRATDRPAPFRTTDHADAMDGGPPLRQVRPGLPAGAAQHGGGDRLDEAQVPEKAAALPAEPERGLPVPEYLRASSEQHFEINSCVCARCVCYFCSAERVMERKRKGTFARGEKNLSLISPRNSSLTDFFSAFQRRDRNFKIFKFTVMYSVFIHQLVKHVNHGKLKAPAICIPARAESEIEIVNENCAHRRVEKATKIFISGRIRACGPYTYGYMRRQLEPGIFDSSRTCATAANDDDSSTPSRAQQQRLAQLDPHAVMHLNYKHTTSGDTRVHVHASSYGYIIYERERTCPLPCEQARRNVDSAAAAAALARHREKDSWQLELWPEKQFGKVPGDGVRARRELRVEQRKSIRRHGAGGLRQRYFRYRQLPIGDFGFLATRNEGRNGQQLRSTGPNSRARLAQGQHRPIRRRSGEHYAARPRHRCGLRQFAAAQPHQRRFVLTNHRVKIHQNFATSRPLHYRSIIHLFITYTCGSIHPAAHVAYALNCPQVSDEELSACLKNRSVQDLLNVKIHKPKFVPAFAPLVDSAVIPDKPGNLMKNAERLSRFDLMYGVTELEKFNLLPGLALLEGLSSARRDEFIRESVKASHELEPELILRKVLEHYGRDAEDERSGSGRGGGGVGSSSGDTRQRNRDLALQVVSDSGIVAPLVATANMHSRANPKSYMYVFSHPKSIRDKLSLDINEQIQRTVHGEELPYVLGIPLSGEGHHLSAAYDRGEALLSKAIMDWWCNFAYSGHTAACGARLSRRGNGLLERGDTAAAAPTQGYRAVDGTAEGGPGEASASGSAGHFRPGVRQSKRTGQCAKSWREFQW